LSEPAPTVTSRRDQYRHEHPAAEVESEAGDQIAPDAAVLSAGRGPASCSGTRSAVTSRYETTNDNALTISAHSTPNTTSTGAASGGPTIAARSSPPAEAARPGPLGLRYQVADDREPAGLKNCAHTLAPGHGVHDAERDTHRQRSLRKHASTTSIEIATPAARR